MTSSKSISLCSSALSSGRSSGTAFCRPRIFVFSKCEYIATRSAPFVEGYSESLWYEVRPFGISVSLVERGKRSRCSPHPLTRSPFRRGGRRCVRRPLAQLIRCASSLDRRAVVRERLPPRPVPRARASVRQRHAAARAVRRGGGLGKSRRQAGGSHRRCAEHGGRSAP